MDETPKLGMEEGRETMRTLQKQNSLDTCRDQHIQGAHSMLGWSERTSAKGIANRLGKL